MRSLHRIKLYQTKLFFDMHENVASDRLFNSKYSCVVDTLATFDKDNKTYILEKIFTHFNFYELHKMKYPINHSVSVGDIIELDEIKYQCMPTGWHKLDY